VREQLNTQVETALAPPAFTSGDWNTVAGQAAGAWEFNAAMKKW